jgi:iron complex transport system substrate-binding protein
MPSPSPRIVSLIASATEIVHALGALDDLVGRSHECDFPPAVAQIPQLTKPKFKVAGSSREIDQRVKALVEQGLAVYEVDAARLKALQPDVILTQDQCEVCAVSLRDVEAAVCDWTGAPVNVVSLKPYSLADVCADIRRIGDALGRTTAADQLVARMTGRIAGITAQLDGAPRPRLAFIEWIDPPMSGGHWMPELVDAARGVNLFGASGQPSPWIKLEDIAAADPDVILVAPCGYDIATTQREMAVLDANPLWQSLRAVRENRIYLADGNAYFNRPGPRLVESIEILADVLHPALARFGHMGSAVVAHATR